MLKKLHWLMKGNYLSMWEPKQVLVLDFDDMEALDWDRNGLNFLIYWKAKTPNLKVNIFAIPGRMTPEFIKLLEPYKDWLQLCVHGWKHNDNFEALKWDEYLANLYLEKAEQMGFEKVFRAPGWQITYPQPYNESPDPTKPVNSDPQLVYRVLQQRGYICADQGYNASKRPEGLQVYCTCNPLMIHGHVEDINVSDPTGRNGMRQIEVEHGVPWTNESVFRFITELTIEELRCTCQK